MAEPTFAFPIAGQRFDPKRVGVQYHGPQYNGPGANAGPIHQGIDLMYPAGTPVVSAVNGTVQTVGWDEHGYGRYIVVRGADGRDYYYGHLSATVDGITPGAKVDAGQHLGAVGSTGNSSGPHLHFEVRPGGAKYGVSDDPTPLLSGNGTIVAGATAVAESQKTTALKREERDLQTRLDQQKADLDAYQKAQRLVPAYRESKTPDAQWLPANGVTKAEMDRLEEVYDRVTSDKELRAAIAKDENALRDLRVKIGDSQDDDAKAQTTGPKDDPAGTKKQTVTDGPNGSKVAVTWIADGKGNWEIDPSSPAKPIPGLEGTKAKPELRTGQDGQTYALVTGEDGKVTAMLVGGMGSKPKTFQIHTLPNGEQWTWDAEAGRLGTKVADAKPTGQMVNGRWVPNGPSGVPDPAGATDLYSPEERAAENRRLAGQGIGSVQANGRVTFYDPTKPEGEQVTGRLDTLSPEERARSDEAAQLDIDAKRRAAQPTFQDPRAAYQFQAQRAQQQARDYSETLKKQVAAGMKTWEQVKQELTSWWQTSMEPALAGYRAQAEQAQYAQQFQIDAAQRAEDDRAAAANREREKAAYQAGEQERSKWRELAPMARSDAFVQQYADNVGKMARGERVTFDPAAITAPAALPNIDQMAQQGAARALAAISPTAARIVGRPLPSIPDLPSLDLNALMPPYAPAA